MKVRLFCAGLLLAFVSVSSRAGSHNIYPLPEERGTAGIMGALEALPIYARVVYTIAHPDDESAGTLTWLARKAHAHTALFALTRGDGGQNVLGPEKYEAMGLLRTGELLEACRIYGVEPFFSTAYEFGFSKSADETLQKWGREATLEEVVRFIRMWRPAVMISAFQGNMSDGHGHHQASGILSTEAFRAAGDPGRFPQHMQAGLQPWQPLKLYERSRGDGAGVRIPVGDWDPVLGRSYRQIGAEGYGKHRSQGNGATMALPGGAYDSYALVESKTGNSSGEESFFSSVDISLLSILDAAGKDKSALPALQADLKQAQDAAAEALRVFEPAHPGKSAPAVAQGIAALRHGLQSVETASVPSTTRQALADALRLKLQDFENAANAVLGVYLLATAADATAVPGQTENVAVSFFNRGENPLELVSVGLDSPESRSSGRRMDAGASERREFRIPIAANAAVTEPFWYRANSSDTRYRTRPTANVFAAFAPPVNTGLAIYRFGGEEVAVSAPVRSQGGDPIRGSDFVDFQIVPLLSVTITPEVAIMPASAARASEFLVSVLNNGPSGSKGTVRLTAPAGWAVSPAEIPFATERKGELVSLRFNVRAPANARPGTYPLEAVAIAGGEFRRGYRVVSYPENWTRHLFAPSRSDVRLFNLNMTPNLTVGYVTGAGDDVPAALEQMGVRVQTLSANDIAFGDLNRFSAIVTGIRAYNVNDDLKTHYRRFLRYVEQGGTLIVQYNQPGRGGSAEFPYGPYPMTVSAADRITVEESPVRILQPASPLLNNPNRITAADFEGWVQERGLYFMSRWDHRYTALLSGNDPGEEPKNGGMLVTRYGKGTYIYTAYAWFRELPAGVPGAYRIFANLLSAGRPPTRR